MRKTEVEINLEFVNTLNTIRDSYPSFKAFEYHLDVNRDTLYKILDGRQSIIQYKTFERICNILHLDQNKYKRA